MIMRQCMRYACRYARYLPAPGSVIALNTKALRKMI